MIMKPETQKTNGNNNNVSKKKLSKPAASVTFSPKLRETLPMNENDNYCNETTGVDQLDEETRLANLAKLKQKG